MFKRDLSRRVLVQAVSLISLIAFIGWGCLEDPESTPLPPLEEGISYDGGMYEPPSDPSSSEGYGYGSGSSSIGAYGAQSELEAGEETP